MHASALRGLVVATALVAAASAGAQTAECELPGAGVDPLAHRERILSDYERLPHACLRALFAACSSASSRDLLDFGSAAACSFGYEALLKHGFGGNFRALMAWWRTQRDEAQP